jgi:tetratricopeptide (TPR) repeat protein
MTTFDDLWDYSNPAATEAKFRALLPEHEAGDDPEALVELLTQIARTEGLQKRFADGHATLDRAASLLRPDMMRARPRLFLERGRLFNSAGDKARARDHFRLAHVHARNTGYDAYAVDAAHMLAIAAETPEEALQWNHSAIELAERSKDERARRWLASLYNNTAWTHHDAGRYEQALDLFQRALKLREQRNQPNETRIAKWCVGRTLRSMNRLDEALAMQQSLFAEHAAAGSKDGYVFEELAECHLALGRPGEARGWFSKAHDEFESDPDFDPKRLARFRELAGIV